MTLPCHNCGSTDCPPPEPALACCPECDHRRITEHRCQWPECGKTFEVKHPTEEPELDDVVRLIKRCDVLGWQAVSMPGTVATFCPDHHQELQRPNR